MFGNGWLYTYPNGGGSHVEKPSGRKYMYLGLISPATIPATIIMSTTIPDGDPIPNICDIVTYTVGGYFLSHR